MSVRSLLNLAYAHQSEGLEPREREILDRRLKEPFEYEMTPEQIKREQARRMLEAKGQSGDPHEVMRYMNRG